MPKTSFSKVTDEILRLSELSIDASYINPDLYTENDVKRGLRDLDGRGVLVPTDQVDLTGDAPVSKLTGETLTEFAAKMSKSLRNVVNPDDIVRDYGADTLRTYEMFIGAFELSAAWSDEGVRGCRRFLERVWKLQDILKDGDTYSAELETKIHQTIKKVDADFEGLKYNTAIAALMTLINEFYKKGEINNAEFKTFLILLNPVAPHITEEIKHFIYKGAQESGADSHTGVVEIGSGVGCLTEQLALRAAKVVSFEIDELLRPVLARTLAPYDNIEVVFRDVLQVDLAEEVRRSFLPCLQPILCANLPYNITTPVLTHIFAARCFTSATIMVQKEVAERMCASPGQKDYGAFTLLTQWYAAPECLFTVGSECFTPRPKVTSAVVRLRMRQTSPEDTDEKTLFRLIRAAFNQRRKTLVNALDGYCGREKARAAAAECGFSETIRGETLSLEDYALLNNVLAKY